MFITKISTISIKLSQYSAIGVLAIISYDLQMNSLNDEFSLIFLRISLRSLFDKSRFSFFNVSNWSFKSLGKVTFFAMACLIICRCKASYTSCNARTILQKCFLRIVLSIDLSAMMEADKIKSYNPDPSYLLARRVIKAT